MNQRMNGRTFESFDTLAHYLFAFLGAVDKFVGDDLVEIPLPRPDVVHQDLVRREGEFVKRPLDVRLRHVLQFNAITQFANNLNG